ncbi:MAG: thioesterase family protein [Acidimicrobiales bacterium]
MTVSPGLTASKSYTVSEDDTAIALGSGDVPVLGTPRMIAWCEEVTVLALEPALESGRTTVGYRIRIDHLAPTPVGATVEVVASVSEASDRQVTLAVTVTDTNGTAAEGAITRVVVDRDRFLAKATGG